VTSATNERTVTASSWIRIILDLAWQDPESGQSGIEVIGQMINSGHASSTSPGNDIGRAITGTEYVNLSHFGFSIAGGATYTFIDETLAISHGSDGTLSVNFTVTYGVTGTTLFLSNQSISCSMDIPQLVPSTPSGLKLSSVTSNSLTLTWNASRSATSYYVDQWNNVGGSGSSTRTEVSGTSTTITGLTPGSGYRFKVTGVNSAGTGGSSSPVTVTLTSAASAPSAPTFKNISARSLTVKWTAPSNLGGASLTGYRVSRYEGPDTSGSSVDTDTSGSGTSLDVTGLDPGATYTFTVIAKNTSSDNGGLSDPSAPSTVTLLAGAWVRSGGTWMIAIPYVRHSGTWQLATPFVRTTKNTTVTWNPTN
jgi:hypothetical protein